MKTLIQTVPTVILILAPFLIGLALFSCSTTGDVDVGLNNGPLGNVGAKVRWGSDGKPTFEFNGTLPPGMCLQVEWVDKDGNTVGTTGPQRPPIAGKVPDGATIFVATVVECPAESPEDGPAVQPARELRPYWITRRYWIASLMPDLVNFNLDRNTTLVADVVHPYWFTPITLLRAVAVTGFSQPIPSNMHVVHYQAVDPITGTLFFGSSNPYTAAAVEINGSQHPGIVQAHLSNGWYMAAVTAIAPTNPMQCKLSWSTPTQAPTYFESCIAVQ